MKTWDAVNDINFSEASARERAFGLADKDTFTELLDPRDRFYSPHLPVMGTAIEFDDGLVSGIGLIGKHPLFINSMEGRFIGGSIGEVNGAKLVMSLRLALETYNMIDKAELEERRPLVVISFETGGVRLHEANAGLLAISEIVDAVADLRGKVPVIAVIGSKVGCFGGMGAVAAASDVVIMSEIGRMGLTGPEVIEQEVGKEEFDASDKSLVYRTTGGKHRYITRDCNFLAEDKVSAFREKIAEISRLPIKEIESMRRIGSRKSVQEQIDFVNSVVSSGVEDAKELWALYGNPEPDKLPDMELCDFLGIVKRRPL